MRRSLRLAFNIATATSVLLALASVSAWILSFRISILGCCAEQPRFAAVMSARGYLEIAWEGDWPRGTWHLSRGGAAASMGVWTNTPGPQSHTWEVAGIYYLRNASGLIGIDQIVQPVPASGDFSPTTSISIPWWLPCSGFLLLPFGRVVVRLAGHRANTCGLTVKALRAMRPGTIVRSIILLLGFILIHSGCVIVPDNTPEPALPPNIVVALDATTRRSLPDAKVVILYVRRNAYFPDGKLGAEKSPAIFVDRLDQAPSIKRNGQDVYIYPFVALGTDYYRDAAWVYQSGYSPVEYPFAREDQNASAKLGVQLTPCDPSQGEAALIQLVLKEIRRHEWKAAAEASLRKQLQ